MYFLSRKIQGPSKVKSTLVKTTQQYYSAQQQKKIRGQEWKETALSMDRDAQGKVKNQFINMYCRIFMNNRKDCVSN